MKKTTCIIYKSLALLLGLPVTIIGLILIPLPGPGVLITIIGLWILSLGFDQVKRPLDSLKQRLVVIYQQSRQRYDDFLEKHNLND